MRTLDSELLGARCEGSLSVAEKGRREVREKQTKQHRKVKTQESLFDAWCRDLKTG